MKLTVRRRKRASSFRGRSRDVDAADHDAAFGGDVERADHVQQRRLAAAGGAEHDDELARAHLEVDSRERVNRALTRPVHAGDAVESDQRWDNAAPRVLLKKLVATHHCHRRSLSTLADGGPRRIGGRTGRGFGESRTPPAAVDTRLAPREKPVITPMPYAAISGWPPLADSASSVQPERRSHVPLDGRLGLVLDELHDGVLGCCARRCCLRRCEAGESAAD